MKTLFILVVLVTYILLATVLNKKNKIIIDYQNREQQYQHIIHNLDSTLMVCDSVYHQMKKQNTMLRNNDTWIKNKYQ